MSTTRKPKKQKSYVPPSYIVPGEKRGKTLARIQKYLSQEDEIREPNVYDEIERLFGIRMTEKEYEELLQDIIDDENVIWIFNKRYSKWVAFHEFDKDEFYESCDIDDWDTSNIPGDA